MPLFLLTPVNLSAREWQLSRYLGSVHVHAADVHQARHRVAQRFDAGHRDRLGNRLGGLACPWLRVDLVKAMQVDKPDAAFPVLNAPPRGARSNAAGRTRAAPAAAHPLALWAAAAVRAKKSAASSVRRFAARPHARPQPETKR